ncbi:MAG: hypothetical protein AB7J34_09125 [Limisphaerales bacterium]
MPNSLNLQDIEEHAGKASLEDLALLARHYYAERVEGYWVPDPADDSWKLHTPSRAELAQSIVVRSEIQPLNICMPRFALRTRFENDPGNASILHLRRLAIWQQYVGELPALRFADRVARERGRHPGIASINGHLAGQPLHDVLAKEPPFAIADSLLTLPSKYLSLRDYHIIRTRLHHFTGEYSNKSRDGEPHSTPYAYTAHRSGGLCAQSCCFMATALLHEHAKTVCGIADISYLAKTDRAQEVFISGLDPDEMNRYFAKAGLAAPVQFPNKALFRRGEMQEANLPVAETQMLRCLYEYTLSDIPTILIVDARRLHRFYHHNGFEPLVSRSPGSPVLHTLLCVGSERTLDAGSVSETSLLTLLQGTIFVVHDPSGMPFMRIRGRDLVASAADADQDRNFPILGLMPVVPGAVRVPLLRTSGSGVGLMEFAGAAGPDSNRHLGFCLAQAGAAHASFEITRPYSVWPEVRHLLAGFCTQRLRALLCRRLGLSPRHWLWFERRNDRVVVWDAQSPLDESLDSRVEAPANRLAEILVANGRILPQINPGATLRVEEERPASSARSSTPDHWPKPSLRLQVGAISSFDTRPYGHPCQLPAALRGVEVYAFMSRDLQDLGVTSDLRHPVHVLAEKEKDPRERDRVAARIAERLKQHYSGRTITGFATYLPELRSPVPEIALMASRYFQFLVRTAACLNRIQAVDGTFTIELVAGAVFDGLWPAVSKYGPDNNGYGVNLISKEKVHRRILRNILPAVKLADRINTPEMRVQFAFESEPGALFALHTFQDLVRFVDKLDNLPESDPRHRLVGLNCDIPHWAFLSDVTIERLSETPQGRAVVQRIVHAHISDHTEGHWADNPLYTSHDAEDFIPWIRLLEGLDFGRPARLPKFSGWVSVELEACRDPGLVSASASSLRKLCR